MVVLIGKNKIILRKRSIDQGRGRIGGINKEKDRKIVRARGRVTKNRSNDDRRKKVKEDGKDQNQEDLANRAMSYRQAAANKIDFVIYLID